MDINKIVNEYEKILNSFTRELVLLKVENDNLKEGADKYNKYIQNLEIQITTLEKELAKYQTKDE